MQPKDNKTYNQYSKVLEICSCKRIYLWKAQCVVKFTSLNTYVLYTIIHLPPLIQAVSATVVGGACVVSMTAVPPPQAKNASFAGKQQWA